MTPGRRGWIVLAMIALSGGSLAAPGHEHHSAAGKFYQTWMQPDHPWVSCCHDEDCAAAAAKFEDGHWLARWTDADEWVQIPDEKVERLRDTPDGRAHMCGRRSGFGNFNVYCFVTGGGS